VVFPPRAKGDLPLIEEKKTKTLSRLRRKEQKGLLPPRPKRPGSRSSGDNSHVHAALIQNEKLAATRRSRTKDYFFPAPETRGNVDDRPAIS
jgi:hypothetical protein